MKTERIVCAELRKVLIIGISLTAPGYFIFSAYWAASWLLYRHYSRWMAFTPKYLPRNAWLGFSLFRTYDRKWFLSGPTLRLQRFADNGFSLSPAAVRRFNLTPVRTSSLLGSGSPSQCCELIGNVSAVYKKVSHWNLRGEGKRYCALLLLKWRNGIRETQEQWTFAYVCIFILWWVLSSAYSNIGYIKVNTKYWTS